MTVIIPIVFESINSIFGFIAAFGLKVLSEEYSKSLLKILNSFGFPILVESKTIDALFPSAEFDPLRDGGLVYPDPPEIILILSIGPFAEVDVVVYFRVLHSS